jgi:hypothetical protein
LHQIWQADPKPWDVWPPDKPFRTPDDYCRAVTGHPWKALLELVKEMGGEQLTLNFRNMEAELARAQAAHRKQGAHHKNLKMKPGQTADYWLRRLARDHPDILARYEKGEFKSVRAAVRAAGLIKEPTPVDRVLRLLPKLTSKDRQRVRQELDKLNEQ